jgi:hypothetical protein
MKKITILFLLFSSLYSMEKKYLLHKKPTHYGTMQKNIIKPTKNCWEDENFWQDGDRKVVFPIAASCGSGFYSWIASMAFFTLCGADITVFWHVPCLVSCATCTTVGGYILDKNWRKKDWEIDKK